jgi:hypothetical protein
VRILCMIVHYVFYFGMDLLKARVQYPILQGSPCPLLTLNPFERMLLHSDVLAGIKWSTWIQDRRMNLNLNMSNHVELEAIFSR